MVILTPDQGEQGEWGDGGGSGGGDCESKRDGKISNELSQPHSQGLSSSCPREGERDVRELEEEVDPDPCCLPTTENTQFLLHIKELKYPIMN